MFKLDFSRSCLHKCLCKPRNHGIICEGQLRVDLFYKVQIFHHTSALSATFSHYGLLNELWGQGIYFRFQCSILQIPISTLLWLFFCLKRSKVSIFYVLEKSDECYLPDLLLDRDCGAGVGRETRNCRVNQYGASNVRGDPLSKSRAEFVRLVFLISYCTHFIPGAVVIIVAVVCMLF